MKAAPARALLRRKRLTYGQNQDAGPRSLPAGSIKARFCRPDAPADLPATKRLREGELARLRTGCMWCQPRCKAHGIDMVQLTRSSRRRGEELLRTQLGDPEYTAGAKSRPKASHVYESRRR